MLETLRVSYANKKASVATGREDVGCGMASTVTKIRWWLDSVRGLKAHIDLYKRMYRLAQEIPMEQRNRTLIEQLRRQEGMIGFCLLHVILVHPVGSGRMD